jgi:phage gpG-like protein
VTQVQADTSDVVRAVRALGVDLHPFFASLGEDLAAEVHDNFKTSGHGSFAALAPSTLKRKAKAGKSAVPLIWNAIWMNSPTIITDEFSAEVTTNVNYAVFHVSKAPRKKIPLRDVYQMTADFMNDVAERLARFIATGGKEGQ